MTTFLHSSPWGKPDTQTVIADGIISLSTPSHGGVWLSEERYKALPSPLRCNFFGGGHFYEEDIEAPIILHYFGIEEFHTSNMCPNKLATFYSKLRRSVLWRVVGNFFNDGFEHPLISFPDGTTNQD